MVSTSVMGGASVNSILSPSRANYQRTNDTYLRPFSFHSPSPSSSSSSSVCFPPIQLIVKPIQFSKKREVWKRHVVSPSAAESAVEALEEASEAVEVEKEKLGVVVKALEKPRLVLKFIWMEKNIGLALDQAIPGHGTIPLSPYYFWPRKDAWEELKTLLESKPWISQKRMIILLNQATDIINLWQQSGGGL